jgi:saccharopine dehydrogenase (NAD+, L-lysine-forming)
VANVFMVVAALLFKKNTEFGRVFSDLVLASRRIESCESIKKNVFKRTGKKIKIHQLDASDIKATIALIRKVDPDIVINLATPTTDLNIMTACAETGKFYFDTANYEPPEVPNFRYEWQLGLDPLFKLRKILAVLGGGFDPGATNIYTAYAAKHYFDEIHYIDIVDCNAGDHGYKFATNFDQETNIREVTLPGRFWENGKWVEIDPIIGDKPGRENYHVKFNYPDVGPRESYLIYHEELQSLVDHFSRKGLKRARFWMTFSDNYLTHLWALQNVGMTRIEPKVEVSPGIFVSPLEFLAKVLPDPGSLGARYKGKTCIGVRIAGIKDGKLKVIFIYNVSSHEEAYRITGGQGISWTTALPALFIVKLILTGEWSGIGIHTVDEFDPDPAMRDMNNSGLITWEVLEDDQVPLLDYELDKLTA